MTKQRDKSFDGQTMRLFWQAALHHKRLLVLALLFPAGAILMTIGVPLVIGRVIGGLSNPQAAVGHYLPYLVAVSVIGLVCNRYGGRGLFMLQANVMSRLQTQAFEGLLRRSLGFHNNNIGGKLVSDATDYPQAFLMLSDALFTNLVPLVLILLTGSVVVFVESWQLGLIVTLMSGYALGSTYYTTRKRDWVRRRRQEMGKEVTGHVADTIVNVTTVKTFAGEEREMSRHRQLNRELTELRLNDWWTGAGMANTRMAVLTAMQIVFVILLIHAVRRDPAVLATGIFAFSFVTTLATRLIQLHPLMRQVEDAFLNAMPITEMLLQEQEIRDIPGAKRLRVSAGAIGLHDVSFQYADSNQHQQVFKDLSLDIKPGEKIGLVGPSGGGKSTLTRLLLRFEDIKSGSITIDGQDIAEVSQQSLRQAVAYVPQEPLLFHRSITDNIAYGKPDAGKAAVRRAAKLAYADDFIRELSDGYDTIVGERGVKLSGGQRQRVAIARAILKDAPILLLDEATSALDSESEVYIQRALLELMKDRTTLVIAHRLSTVQTMDRIVVLDNGRITEQGTHQQLLERKGTYAKLWNHQTGGFIND